MFKNASNYIELLRNWQRTLAPPRPPQVPQVAFGDGSKKSIERQVVHRVCCDCTEKRVCKKCDVAKARIAYTASEWKHATKNSRGGNCLECVEYGNVRQCSGVCGRFLSRIAYASEKIWERSDPDRICKQCSRGVTNVWKCIECKDKFAKCEFSAWLRGRKNQSKHPIARCNLCSAGQDMMKAKSCAATVAGVVRR